MFWNQANGMSLQIPVTLKLNQIPQMVWVPNLGIANLVKPL